MLTPCQNINYLLTPRETELRAQINFNAKRLWQNMFVGHVIYLKLDTSVPALLWIPELVDPVNFPYFHLLLPSNVLCLCSSQIPLDGWFYCLSVYMSKVKSTQAVSWHGWMLSLRNHVCYLWSILLLILPQCEASKVPVTALHLLGLLDFIIQ